MTTLEHITLGGGCFWCTEAVFRRTRGIHEVESGYANGQTPSPDYESVCTGRTGHAEVVRLGFDPAEIGLAEVLDIFFTTHDPTTLNRQGNDVGTQYRSGIYWEQPGQADVAAERIEAWTQAATWGAAPIVTEVQPLKVYHPAEDYHQRYFELNPHAGYCAFVVAPKVAKLRQKFADRSSDSPTAP